MHEIPRKVLNLELNWGYFPKFWSKTNVKNSKHWQNNITKKKNSNLKKTNILDKAKNHKIRKSIKSIHINKNLDHIVNFKIFLGGIGMNYTDIINEIDV